MKPSWDDAPKFANWLAQDPDGMWFWFELKPTVGVWVEGWVSDGLLAYAGQSEPEPEPRP